MNSSRLNRNGPEPVGSSICLNGSVSAMRSGMMKHDELVTEPRERPSEAEPDRAVVRHAQLVDDRLELLAVGVALHPPPDARHRVTGNHGAAVVECEAVTQGDRDPPAIVFDDVARRHLRLRAEFGISAV